ncbi:MAG: aminotransferase class V-fold PLP-dependent enzyme [bacterium]
MAGHHHDHFLTPNFDLLGQALAMDRANQVIYLDNAATTFPKPREVLKRIVETYTRLGVSPGRGSYDLAMEAEEFVQQSRRKLARFFCAPDPERVIFANNATDALNLAIQGLLQAGHHVVATRLEHNSVLRPLFHFRQIGMIEYDLVPFNGDGFIDPRDVADMMRPNTRLVIICHASNVLGTIQPIAEVGRLCADRGVPLMIDASQSAGHVPIDMDAWGVSIVAFTGHKSLYGPTGIGGLLIRPDLKIQATRFGGTGIESRSLIHTQTFPHRLEAGTINLLGIIGLSAGLDYVLAKGMDEIHRREMELLRRLRDGLSELQGVDLYCAQDLSNHVAVLTTNVRGIEPEDVGAILDVDFGVAARTGLHCAPLIHEDLGTSPRGGVRFSLGCFNTAEDIDSAIEAMASICKHRSK